MVLSTIVIMVATLDVIRAPTKVQRKQEEVTPGVVRRKEKTYQIALHVLTTQKHNPNADVKPVENPYVVEKSFFQRSKFEQIV